MTSVQEQARNNYYTKVSARKKLIEAFQSMTLAECSTKDEIIADIEKLLNQSSGGF